jgi:N-ethylmaleimide reductase
MDADTSAATDAGSSSLDLALGTVMTELFSPIQIGNLLLPQRVVMAPLTRSRAGQPGNVPTALNVEYYRQRAGAGLIITEATQISQQGQGYAWTPGIFTEDQVKGWAEVAEAVHDAGGRIFLQLWHVGRVSHPTFQPDGGLPVAPTAMEVPGKTFIAGDDGQGAWSDIPVPQEIDEFGIDQIVADYFSAAQNAMLAGMDGVEIHAGNGYLLDQFINSNSNKRTDKYGGSIENRVRLLLEVTDAVVEAVGSHRVGVRMTPMGRFLGMGDETPMRTYGHAAEQLARRALAYLHLVEPEIVGTELDKNFDPRWPEMMKILREAYSGTLILAGGFNLAKAEAAIEQGRCDMVAFGRLFIANPDLPERFRIGASLNTPDPTTFFGGDAHGYIDYPSLQQELNEPDSAERHAVS